MSGFILKTIARSLERIGVPSTSFYGSLGIDPGRSTDSFVEASRVARYLSTLAQELGDESLGLTLAREIDRAGFGAFAQAVWTGGNLGDAMARSTHFYGIMSTEVVMALERSGKEARLVLKTPKVGVTTYGRHGWVLSDLLLGWHFVRARASTNHRFRVDAANFRHRARKPEAYEAFFECTVNFGQTADELVFSSDLLLLPARAPQPHEGEARESRPPRPIGPEDRDSFLSKVRAFVVRGLREQNCTVTRLARDLGMSERTFQRHLYELGTSHREIVDDVRHRLALELVARGDMPMAGVARELGFARVAAFYRAFTRWTGTTPRAVREGAHRAPEE